MSSTSDRIVSIEAIYLRIPRAQQPHQGLMPSVNSRGYVVDPDNGTVYPVDDRTVVVKATCESGRIGWGETYGITAGTVICELIKDVIDPILCGRDPLDVKVIWQDLYNLMRVRGYTSGFWLDALAAVDIALWDLCGKILNQPVHKLLGGQRRKKIPAYITNIGGSTNAARMDSVNAEYDKGFRAFKVHAARSYDYIALLRDLRATYPDIALMLDMHWVHTSAEALSILRKVEALDLTFVEAPCRYEDIDGLARVAAGSTIPIAGGEEWRTVYDAHPRLKAEALSIIQPEMGRSGITQFMQMADLASVYHARVMPHATIGFGIFMAASLQASAAIEDLPMHEYQNTVLPRHLPLFETQMICEGGFYNVPDTPGIGIEPKEAMWDYVA
jgi:D-galactarolactone cycloisomerase